MEKLDITGIGCRATFCSIFMLCMNKIFMDNFEIQYTLRWTERLELNSVQILMHASENAVQISKAIHEMRNKDK